MNRDQEKRLWTPVLHNIGFTDFRLAATLQDQEQAIDAFAVSPDGVEKAFALRSRATRWYVRNRPQNLVTWKTQFTIRYARPSGVRTEWNKLFDSHPTNGEELPDYMCYGWQHHEQLELHEWLILSVPVLQDLFKAGILHQCIADIRRNTDERQADLAAISLPCLLAYAESQGLVVRASDDHPGIPHNPIQRTPPPTPKPPQTQRPGFDIPPRQNRRPRQ